MDERPRPPFGTRDALWLAVLGLVLAAWGSDRGRLQARIEQPQSEFSPEWVQGAHTVPPLFAVPTLDEIRADPVLSRAVGLEPVADEAPPESERANAP